MSGDQHNQADPLNLDAITERYERAVDGPWTPSMSITGWAVVVGEGPAWVADVPDEGVADFIACASEDVPALVAEVRRLRAQVERVEWLHQSNDASVAKCIEDGQLWPCVTLGEMARTE